MNNQAEPLTLPPRLQRFPPEIATLHGSVSRLGGACPTVPGARCDTERLGNAAILGLTGAALGGTLGYLVGRFSPKRPRIAQPTRDSLLTSFTDNSARKRVGYHHLEGMAIGAGASAALMALLYLGVPKYQPEPPTTVPE